MRLHALRTLSLLLATALVGCGSGDTPTPVPSNTPIDSPQDVSPRDDNDDESESATDNSSDKEPNSSDVAPPPPDDVPMTEETPKADAANDAAASTDAKTPTDSAPDKPASSPASPSNTEQADLAALEPEQLIERLADDKQRDAATRALVAKGPATLEALKTALDNEDWQVRAAAVFTIGQLGEAAAPAHDKLKQIAEQDENPAVRDAAAFALDALTP